MFEFPRPSNFERSRYGRFSGVARRTVTMMAVLGAGVAVMGAQSSAPSSPGAAVVSQAGAGSESLSPVKASDAVFSSSAAEEVPAIEASVTPMTPNFAAMVQYGGGQRQRYGRPRYRGNNTNADGSSKWIFYGGAGLSQPIGNTWHYFTPSYGLEVGGGRQFSKHFAVPIEFDWDHFGLTKSNLDNQVVIYDTLFGAGSVDGLLDGNNHVWSFSVDPTYTFYQGDAWGAYAVVGAGFYHKVTDFTLPQDITECFEFCETFQENETIDDYTANAPGFSGGFGLTYKFSRFTGERFYAEAKYVFVDNSQRTGVTVNNLATAPSTSTNFFPANSNRTTFIPIKVGIRF